MSIGLLRNSLSNFFAGIVPAIASLLAVPVIVSHLGAEQYGVFALLTSIVGYFAILDINVTAGSMKYLSEYRARGDSLKVGQVVTCGAMIYTVIGIVGMAALLLFASSLIREVFKIPANLALTATLALKVGAVAFLFAQLQTYLTSVPQALLRYDISARFEASFGAMVSIATLGVVLAGGGLIAIMAVRLALSMINAGLLARVVGRLLPKLSIMLPDRETVKAITSFSAYAYLSRLATITYQNADKLLIGAMVGVEAVALYTVPFVLTNRVYGMVYRLAHTMFPLTSKLAAENRQSELREIYLTITRYLIYLNACICGLLALFAREILHYWAGPSFGVKAAQVLILVTLAAFIDSLTNLPALVNDGLGRPRNTGVFAVIRAVVGFALAYFSILGFGYVGAAWAQLATACIMVLAFLIFVHRTSVPIRFVDVCIHAYRPTLVVLPLVVALASLLAAQPPASVLRTIVGIFSAIALAIGYGYLFVLKPEHRQSALDRFRGLWLRTKSA